MAMRTKIRPADAEPAGCGWYTVKGENEVWPDFHPRDKDPSPGSPDLRRNPKGRGQFSSFRRPSSLVDTRYASLLTPRTEKNWLPATATPVVLTGPSDKNKDVARMGHPAQVDGLRRKRP